MVKKSGGIGIGLIVIIALFLLLAIGGILWYFLHVPVEILVIGFIILVIIGIIVLLVLILSGRKKTPNLYKKNYEKVADACLVSIPSYLFNKEVYLESGALLGKLKGFAHITDEINRSKEYVFYIERKGGLLQNLLPFLKQYIAVRVKPALVLDLTAPDIVIKTNTVKRLDNYFYTPIQSTKEEFEQLKEINKEVYREYSVFTLDKLAEMTEKSMKANPSFIQRKDVREGGLGINILKGDDED